MKKLFDLTGKVAIVTGASSGMGRAIAEALGANGAKIIISSNEEEGLVSTIQDFQTKEIDCLSVFCDMSNRENIDALYKKSVENFGNVDILVNCVGIATIGGLFEIKADIFERVMSVNVQAAIYLTKLVVPSMQARREGAIIYLASIAGVLGNKNLEASIKATPAISSTLPTFLRGV